MEQQWLLSYTNEMTERGMMVTPDLMQEYAACVSAKIACGQICWSMFDGLASEIQWYVRGFVGYTLQQEKCEKEEKERKTYRCTQCESFAPGGWFKLSADEQASLLVYRNMWHTPDPSELHLWNRIFCRCGYGCGACKCPTCKKHGMIECMYQCRT